MIEGSAAGRHETRVALGLVFASGFAALIYQVLWMKQIGLLFGNTSHAAGTTLASFFAGLALGSWFFGRRVATAPNPMRTYAWLEAGIAVTALLYFAVMALYRWIYPPIFQGVGPGALLTLIKFGLSLLLVFPPAFCMGGTIPVIGQFMVRERRHFGRISALMYGLNTLGAALGAALAGFYLPLWLGFGLTCGLAILLSALVALVAFRLSRSARPVAFQANAAAAPEEMPAQEPEVRLSRQERRQLEREHKRRRTPALKPADASANSPPAGGRRAILFLGFVSGFGVLALEVLWTRLFSQVLENSVYTFAAILVIVLICLALGALLSSQLARLKAPPFLVLTGLILAGAVAVTFTPAIFLAVTDGMQVVASTGSWFSYILLIFRTGFITIGPSALLLGMIFPYLMKVEERHVKSPGLSLGQLAAANTAGAILGALLCGFLLLDALKLWGSMQVIALVYIAAALLLPLRWDRASFAAKAACLGVLLINGLALKPDRLPVLSTDPLGVEERLVESWEGSDCTVAVTDSRYGLAIKINSHYSLGATGSYMQEKFQADLPLMVYPETESLFFLGVGTGTTAGSALDPRHSKVQRVVACELVPEVITAAKKYMTDVQGFDTTDGLFEDPRAEVLIEDGRHYLMATDQRFDIINADLFVPFRSGAGSLYTREHFENARKRLSPDGVFVQWLPLYQLTENEFSIIARTMVEVFDQVSLWRHNFQPGDEIVALIGHQPGCPLPASDLDSSADKLLAVSGKDHRDLMRLSLPLDPQTILLFYGGNLTAARSLFEDHPVNTDNRPVIEYMAPRSYRRGTVDAPPWFTGKPFADFVDKLQQICPPDRDPLLVNRTKANHRLPLAGSAFHHARIAEVEGDDESARKGWEKFVSEWTDR
ncbi:fused MFS/spermidine synthase [Haloferula sp. A504]|uniref:fused MFS/spermidine synthase n=1 Tax=Haloferula sp. A504 TaxID=3373601 RepID=UPI0031BF7B26|nr:fused MFS/spermidine synthase [Verrucomicrobiaceae bacterium E54]